MEVANAAGVELAAQLGGDGGGDQLARGGQIVEPLEQLVRASRGIAAPQLCREAAGRGDVGDRQDARHDLDVDPGRGHFVLEAEEAVGREEELGDRAVGAGVDLALEIVEIGVRRSANPGGISG